jgi:tRNA/rRNA methyltransferase
MEFDLVNMQKLSQVRIVLVEPAGARNVGSIARVMANMGLSQLYIVAPQCDWAGDESQHMAVHGCGVLEQAQIFSDLPTALSGCQRVVATTHREVDLPRPPAPPAQTIAWLWEATADQAIIFGREDSGLTNQELDFAQRYLRIPVAPAYTSLNLAQAVGICAYELQQLAVVPVPAPLSKKNLAKQGFAPAEQVDRYCQQLEVLLLNVGYLQPHTAANRMAKLRRIANRAELSDQELALLWGITSQINWRIDGRKTP